MVNRKIVYDYLQITLGSILIAVGLIVFLVPNKIAAGGVSGIATLIHYLLDWPVGRVILALNIPLFLAGFKELGLKYGIRSLYGVFTLSLATDIMDTHLSVLTEDPLLAALYGGGIIGVGLGLVFRASATTGGTDIIAQFIAKYTNFSAGKGLMIVDFFVIVSAGFVFNAELALYALVSLFIVGRVIDFVQEGLNVAKAAFIISDAAPQIKEELMAELDRGVTVFKGEGGFTEKDKEILLCIISRSELAELKWRVQEIDEDGFVIITDVHEVLGEGFRDNLIQDV